MSRRPHHRVQRRADGTYAVALPEAERDLVSDLVEQLRSVLLESTDAPTVRRLFPTAYNQDPERDREYQQLVRDELLERRLAALEIVTDTVRAESLTEAQLNAWVSAVNDLRLVLGTRLDVTEDLTEIDEDDPDAMAYAVYEYLALLLGEAVDALSEGLAEPSGESGI